MESINCIFCEKDSTKIIWTESGYSAKKCGCGLIYISPRPDFNEIKKLYRVDHASIPAEHHIRAEFAKRLEAKFKLNLIKKYISQGKLLEIGAGAGYFLDEARKEGFEVFGNELNLKQARFMAENLNIPVETDSLNETSFSGTKFDCIYHCDVLSHFYNPFNDFTQFNNKLTDNGIMIFETGKGDLSLFWLKFIGRLQLPDHLFFYSRKHIEQLCERTGFYLITAYRYSTFPNRLTLKLVELICKLLRKHKPNNKAGTKSNLDWTTGISPQSEEKNLKFKKILHKGWSYFNHFMRYKTGKIFPKFGPETVIYVAKKK